MKIKIYEKHTNQLLESFAATDSEKAYQYAKQMEELGVEINMDIPSVNHSLGHSLGMTEEQLDNLTAAIDEEISSHNDCCSEEMPESE